MKNEKELLTVKRARGLGARTALRAGTPGAMERGDKPSTVTVEMYCENSPAKST